MTYQRGPKNRALQFTAAAIRYFPIVLRKAAKRYFVPWVFPFVFVIDGIIIKLARIFPVKSTTRRVIFVRSDNLGDFILWIPAAKAIRANWRWPGCRYVLIANDAWSRFAEELHVFDEVIPISRAKFQRRPFYRVAKLFQLARIGADLLVTPIHSRDPTTADSIARAINAARKCAPVGNSNLAYVDPRIPNGWYNELISSRHGSVHESLKNNEFAEGLLDIKIDDPWPRLDILAAGKLPDEIKNRAYVVFAPGASSPYRAWPSASFSIVAKRLLEEFSYGAVLIGTESERRETEAMSREYIGEAIDLTARTDIGGLMAVLGHAKLIVTNETGTAHLGAALRVPTVCITGGGHFGRFVPYPREAMDAGIKVMAVSHQMPCFNCNWNCIYPIKYFDPAPCVSEVSVDAAWSAVKRLMNSDR